MEYLRYLGYTGFKTTSSLRIIYEYKLYIEKDVHGIIIYKLITVTILTIYFFVCVSDSNAEIIIFHSLTTSNVTSDISLIELF